MELRMVLFLKKIVEIINFLHFLIQKKLTFSVSGIGKYIIFIKILIWRISYMVLNGKV